MNLRRSITIILAGLFTVAAGVSKASSADAQSTQPEKYALMIGINAYASSPLTGCENDTKAVKDLLVRQFGFIDDKEHIKVLYSKQATKQAIVDAFKSHLIENAKKLKSQAKEGIFVFQYSGHGSQVTDQNGDEADGLDETLCPVDVIVSDPKNDLIDDEMEVLVKELTDYTDNLTLIMDCCHSGSNTRALDFTARRLERPNMLPAEGKSRGLEKKADKQILPPNQRYVALSGCMPDELALETTINGKNQGLMTNALVDALSTDNSELTYRQLWAKITAKVNQSATSQNPQIEGDLNRIVFKGVSSRECNSFKVTNADKDDEVVINAGTAIGVENGGIVAFYKKGVKKLSGDEGKINIGDVTEATNYSATVKLRTIPGNDVVMTDAQVVPVTPFFGKKKLTVALQSQPKKSSLDPSTIFNKLSKVLSTKNAFNFKVVSTDPLVERKKDWSVAVVRKKGIDFVNAGGNLSGPNSDAAYLKDGYFIVSREGGPLYNLFVPADTVNGDKIILTALENRSRQEALRTFNNDRTELANAVDIKIERVLTKTLVPGSKSYQYTFKDDTKDNADNLSIPTFKIGDSFRLSMQNKSEHKLYLSGLCVGADGGIAVAFPPQGAGEPLEKGRTVKSNVLKIGGPVGLETLQIIVTSGPVDYSSLQQETVATKELARGGTRGGGDSSDGVKDMLLQAMYKPGDVTRTLGSDAPELDDWCTKRIDYRIIKK